MIASLAMGLAAMFAWQGGLSPDVADDSLEGVWELVLPADIAAKRPENEGLRLVIAGGWQGRFQGDQRVSASRLKVEPQHTPKRLSFDGVDGQPMRGIYEVKEDGLRLSIAPDTDALPKKFGTEHPEFKRVTGKLADEQLNALKQYSKNTTTVDASAQNNPTGDKTKIDKTDLPKVSNNYQAQTIVLNGLVSGGGIIERIEGETIHFKSGDRIVVPAGTMLLLPKRGERPIAMHESHQLEPGMVIAYSLRNDKIEKLVLIGIVEQITSDESVFDKIKALDLRKGHEMTHSFDGRFPLRLTGADGEMMIKIGETRLIKLAEPTESIEWRVGEFKPEGIDDIEPFDYLLVQWRDNGRFTVTCYSSPPKDATDEASVSPEGSKIRPQPLDGETVKEVPLDGSFDNSGTLTKTQPHESRIPVRAKLLVVKRDWSDADEMKPQDGIRMSLSELPDSPVSQAARVHFAEAGSLGPDDLVSSLGLPSVFGAEDFASLQSWLRDQGLLLGELPVEQQAELRSDERWTSRIDLSAAHVAGFSGKWSLSVDMRPASTRPDDQGIFRVVNHPYHLAFINISRTQQVMENQPGGPRLRGASLSKTPKFSFYLPKKRVVAIDWDAPFTGKLPQINDAHSTKVILVFEDAEVPEPQSTVAEFRLPERIGSLYLDDESRWLSPPKGLGDIDRAVATARPEPVTDAASLPASHNTPAGAAKEAAAKPAGRQELLESEKDSHQHPPIEFRIAVSKADRNADGVAWFPIKIVEPHMPIPEEEFVDIVPVAEQLDEQWRGLLWDKTEHTLLSDRTWRVVKCEVARSAQSTDLAPSFEIQITLDAVGGALLRRLTGTHLNQSLAIVVDGTIVAAPMLRSEFGEAFVITGTFSKAAAEKLAAAIRKTDLRKTVSFLVRFADVTSAVAAMKDEAASRKIRGFEATVDPRLNAVAITADADTLEALQDSVDGVPAFRAENSSKDPTSTVVELADLGPQHDGKEVTMIFKITDTQLIGGDREGVFPHVKMHYEGMKKPPYLSVYVKGELADFLHRSACVSPDDKLVGRSIKASGMFKLHKDFPNGEDQTPIYYLDLRDWKKFQILREPNPKSPLVGVWIAENVTTAGEVVPKEKFPFELHFENDKLIYRFVAPSSGKDRFHEIVFDES